MQRIHVFILDKSAFVHSQICEKEGHLPTQALGSSSFLKMNSAVSSAFGRGVFLTTAAICWSCNCQSLEKTVHNMPAKMMRKANISNK